MRNVLLWRKAKTLICIAALACIVVLCSVGAYAATEIFPIDVQTIVEDGAQSVVKTYVLSLDQNPSDIPRDSFVRNGWEYTLTDITENKSSSLDTYEYVEVIEILTESKDVNEIVKLIEPTLDYVSEDGYAGLLALDISTINCEADSYGYSSRTLSTTREYPNLSMPDTSLIPKTITHENRQLELDNVSWDVRHYNNVDYENVPDAYDAIAYYSAVVPTSWVSSYKTTASYTGEVSKTIIGDTVYTVYFEGKEIDTKTDTVEKPETTSIQGAQSLPTSPAADNTNNSEDTAANINSLQRNLREM